MRFRGYSVYANAPEWYLIRTLPSLLISYNITVYKFHLKPTKVGPTEGYYITAVTAVTGVCVCVYVYVRSKHVSNYIDIYSKIWK